ncbi:gliding motility protein [Sorangium cellulosum]|uniref:Gliding motility protein n=1 Tax=Sorangium cellulosum TaxID=56 RepID=A0A2L0EMU2_SORCE|nr:gliding-motility protein MglA [Sorangium cellulosum]AUX40624.1 gliding motility protein [Sorangium cellulosum]
MAFINYASREIYCKIVYYGPGLGGKTTNVRYVYDRTVPSAKGKLISLKTESDRTLFFDFMPLDLGTLSGFQTRLQLYTVPGQIFYKASRKLILKGMDGVVFVADSQRARLDANLESMADLWDNLREEGRSPGRLPLVIQYNKRDLAEIAAVAELHRLLNPHGAPEFEAAAASGRGVFDTLRSIAKLALKELQRGHR